MQLRHAGLYGDGFTGRADLQNDRRQPDAILREELDLVFEVFLETGQLYSQRIGRRRQRGDDERAFFARGHFADKDALGRVCQCHRRAGDHGSLAVLNDAADGTERLLR